MPTVKSIPNRTEKIKSKQQNTHQALRFVRHVGALYAKRAVFRLPHVLRHGADPRFRTLLLHWKRVSWIELIVLLVQIVIFVVKL